MEAKRFHPHFDKLFWLTFIPTLLLLIAVTALTCGELIPLLILSASDVFTLYFFISPFFAYAELREDCLFIKFGFFAKREIPYSKIRGITTERKIYADSMMSIKNALEHVNVKYNTFDSVSISVVTNEEFIKELKEKCNFN
jgi:hypothetical protein